MQHSFSHNALGWYDWYLIHCRTGYPVTGSVRAGIPDPLTHDGAGVQLYIGIVIELS